MALVALGAGCRFGFEEETNVQAPYPFEPDPPAPPRPDAGSTSGDGEDAATDGSEDAGPEPVPSDGGSPVDAGAQRLDAGTEILPVRFPGADTTALRGGTGGSSYAEDCPADHALVGFEGRTSTTLSWITRLRPVCAPFDLEAGASAQLTMGERVALRERGTDGDVLFTRSCPAGHALVGFSGRTGQYLDQLVFHCVPLVIADGPSLTVGAATSLTAVGGTGGTPFGLERCPSGQVARGVFGRSGQWVDALGFVCGTPTVP